MADTETNTETKSRPGPLPGPETKKYTVLLPPDLGDWGKRQPGGLSDLMRRLMAEAREAQQAR